MRTLAICLVAAVFLITVAAVSAAETDDQVMGGSVTRISDTTISIKTGERLHNFTIQTSTQFLNQKGEKAKRSDINVGNTVAITYRSAEGAAARDARTVQQTRVTTGRLSNVERTSAQLADEGGKKMTIQLPANFRPRNQDGSESRLANGQQATCYIAERDGNNICLFAIVTRKE